MILRCVPALLALACFAHSAELDWSGAPGDKPPVGWAVQAPAEAKVVFLERAIEITAPNHRQALAVASTALPDGSDDRPMRLTAQVSAWGPKPVEQYPVVLALEWGGGAVFAVGLGDDPHAKRDERRAWALWSGRGVDGSDHGETELGAGASPAHLRIVLTTREVVAYGSRDGWVWGRIAGIARDRIGAGGAPARVVVGRGLLRPGTAGLAADPPGDAKGEPCTYRFADMQIDSGAADIPASLLRTYAKKDSLADTVDALSEPGIPRQWRVRGPEDGRSANLPVQLPSGFTDGDGWKPQTLDEGGHILQLGNLMPGGGEQVRWATCSMTQAESGLVRFRFDGTKRCWLWVAGQLLSAPDRETNEAEADRRSASVWLPAGTHQIVLAVRGGDGRASSVLRWEPGDPRARIALLRRLNIDFAGDEQLVDAPFEIARLWEGLGFAREAVAALAEVAATGDGDVAERAIAERARLLHQLGDEAGASNETAALLKLWEGTAADPLSAARRTARLWQRLDVPERALAILADAVKLPDLTPQARSVVIVDRARLRHAQGDEPGAASELIAAAAALPQVDPSRFDLLALAARLDPQARQPVEELAKMATDAMRARQLAGVNAARQDESARLTARRLAATLPGTALAMPAIELAEDLAAAKDESGALQLYQQELARRKLPTASNLAEARSTLIRAVLAERPAGAALIADLTKLLAGSTGSLSWKVNGPHPLGDWTTHERPAFDLTAVPAGKVGDQPWRDAPLSGSGSGTLDMATVGGGDGVVYYLATVIARDADGPAVISLGADDALCVWLNGERIYADRTQRGMTPDSIILNLRLRKGANVLVCSVQNGGGGYAFQYRLHRSPWPATDIAAALQGERAAAALTLADIATSLAGNDRTDEAWALARTVIACFPERSEEIRAMAGAVIAQAQWKLTPVALVELVAWFDAVLADRRWDDAETRRWVADNVPGLLINAGLVDRALNRLRRSQNVELEAKALAGDHLREADLWLNMGQPRTASAAMQRARDAAPGDAEVDRWVETRRRAIRIRKGDVVQIVAPFEMATLIRTAERAMTTDPNRAASDLQQIIETGGDQPVQLADGRLRGAAAYAAERLVASGAAVTGPWHERQDSRAEVALARASADDVQALAAVALRWPLAPAGGEAIRREIVLWTQAGAWPLVLGTARRALASTPGDPSLLARASEAAARLGDATNLDALLAQLAKAGKPVMWDGAAQPPERFAGTMRALLPSPAAEPRPATLLVRTPRYAGSLPEMMAADARLPTPALAWSGEQMLVATPDAVASYAADGTQRWMIDGDRLASARIPQSALQRSAAALASDGGIAVAGLVSAGGRRLIGLEAATGRQLWSTADSAELGNAMLASAPTLAGGRVWAWFVDGSRGMVACLDAAQGRVLWISTLASGQVRQPMSGIDYTASGDAPAPALSGRELFVSTDAGQIGAFDAVDGRLLWLHAYPRTTIDANGSRAALRRLMARGRGVVLADNERIYVAPRDTLGMLALRRGDGAMLWNNPLSDVGELSALTPAGLVAIGPAVSMHAVGTGAELWRWRPASGLPGPPLATSEGLLVPTGDGVVRLALADGAAINGPTWSVLACGDARPTHLLLSQGALLAAGDGIAVRLGGAATKPTVAELSLRTRLITGSAVPAGEAKPVALALRWELPIGSIERLVVPRLQPDEAYVMAGGMIRRLDAVTGVVAWAVPSPSARVRDILVDGSSMLVLNEASYAVHDRATGRLRWQDVADRDPGLFARLDERGRQVTHLDGDRILRFGRRDSWFTVRDANDGRRLLRGTAGGGIMGLYTFGDGFVLVVMRDNKSFIELRRADGSLASEKPIGVDGADVLSVHVLANDDLIVGGPAGGALIKAGSHEIVRFDLRMRSFHTVWTDGDRITLVGTGNDSWRHRTASIDAAGKLLSHEEFMLHGDAADRLQLASRHVGNMRVRAVSNRNGQAGIIGWKPDGAEAFWLPTRDGLRRAYHALVPYGRYAVAFCNDRDGWLLAQIIDPQAGKIEVESSLGMTPAWRVLPQEAGGNILIGTTRGLVAAVSVATATEPLPGRGLGEAHEALWRMTKPMVVDGRLDEWEDQAAWELPAAMAARGPGHLTAAKGPLSAWAAWRDDAFVAALDIPLTAQQAATTIMAVDTVRGDFDPDALPLLMALEWHGGAPAVRLVNQVVGEDPARPRIQARAVSDGASLTWEVQIPWAWLYPGNERPGRDHWLRWGAAVHADQGDRGYELASGLFDGFDKAVLMRLRLVDGRPEPDAEQPQRVVPRKGIMPKPPAK